MEKQPKKKVLFVAVLDSFVKSFLLPYLEDFHNKGYEVHVVTSEKNKIPFCDKKHQIYMTRSPFSCRNLVGIREMEKLITEERFDIVSCHTPMGGAVTRIAARSSRKRGTRVIYTAHGFHFFKGAPFYYWALFYPVEKILSRFTDTLITINEEDYGIASKKFNHCRDIQYISGIGVDDGKMGGKLTKKEKTQFRQSLGLKDDDFVLIFPARLDKNKNQRLLIMAMQKLTKDYPNIHLLLPGIDEINGEYQKLTQKTKLLKNVHFLGYRSDIPKLLQISDVAVSSSKREGLPINVIESMYFGLPAIVSDVRGNRNLVINKKGGIIFSNLQDFVVAVEKLYNNRSLCGRYGDFNRQESAKYLLDSIINNYRQIYFRKKTVLNILASNKFSGAENVACTIIDQIKNSYDAIYCSLDGPIRKTLQDRRIEYAPIKKMRYKDVKSVIKKYNPDIIHAHDFRASFCAALCKKKNQKLILHIHRNDPKMRKITLVSIIFLFVQKKADKIIWVSEDALNDYCFREQCLSKSILIENEIDIEKVLKLAKKYQTDKFDIIFLGRLSAQKNPLRFVNIIKIVTTIKPDVKAVMVGDGSLKRDVIKKIKEDNLEKNIQMFGFVENPYPILANSKILCLTSVFEGLPMVILEANALGKTIISTPIGGVAKMAEENANVILSNHDKEIAALIVKYSKRQQYWPKPDNGRLNLMISKITTIYEAKNV